ncbi:hypothetical protein CCZ01_08120 [Helicobacter monodelphidis]|uniref:class I SAM-dependent methyltransferase n=1 Tax=Helicobacter sp. 15-1451 TaxID=2004995 RepID=UPI000DCF336B|nr:methyltransferase domain-containing protein [Helicobacter sp. 15-1451]RAX56896.1 hypothetical protein CCZ01_08120 [Helicobacter sp. 15-1451]
MKNFWKKCKKIYYESLRFVLLRLAYICSWGGGKFYCIGDKLLTFHRHSYGKDVSGSYWLDRNAYFANNMNELHKTIKIELKNQKNFYKAQAYCDGYLYQGLGIANILGVRGSEERFDEYGLQHYLCKDMLLYDLGCNSGFLSLYCHLRTGCSVRGVDINPYMINIANATAKAFGVKNVEFFADDLNNIFVNWEQGSADVILTLATMWTDDEQYRVSLKQHFDNCLKLLKKNGVLVFETHGDVSRVDYVKAINELACERGFRLLEQKDVDCKARKLFIIQT